MKMRRTKFVRGLFAIVLLLSIITAALPSTDIQAAKMTNKKAQKILKKVVKNKFSQYAFVDIDNDKIDEMIALGYSGKFKDGDDKKKTVDIYKVSGKKAVSVFNDSIKGDIFYPLFTFEAHRDSSDNCYIKINKEHEGDCRYTTYKYNGKSFEKVAEVRVTNAEFEYSIGSKKATEKAYNDLIEEIFANEIKLDIKKSSVKVTNKYIKKMLKAEFNRRCKAGLYDKDIVSCVYSDEDGNGIDEMIIRKGPISGDIMYAYEREGGYDYLVDVVSYKIEDGRVVFDVPSGDDQDDADSYLGLWQYDRCSLKVTKDGDAYVFDIIWGSSASESTEWIYYTVFEGVDSEGNAKFSSDLWGRMFEIKTDPATGKDTVETVYENGRADFVISNGKMTWYDYYKDTTQTDQLVVFDKVTD